MDTRIIDALEQFKAEGKSWEQISGLMRGVTGEDRSGQAWRNVWRRAGRAIGRSESTESIVAPLDERLLGMLGAGPVPVGSVCLGLGATKKIVDYLISGLQERGYDIIEECGMYLLDRRGVQSENVIVEKWDGAKAIKFLALSDTHLCSKYQQLGFLNEAYDMAIAEGCQFAIHCGDLGDGFYKNREDHIYELFKAGYDDQLEYCLKAYPRRKLPDGSIFKTKIIGGNHDHTHKKNGGANFVKAFASHREDVEFLGQGFCKIWLTPKCDLDVVHPGDGSQYAISYSSQKMIDALQGGQKPKVMLVGHHHKGLYYSYRNIHTFEVPCLQEQTPFERGAKIFVVVGWWIITLHVSEDGTVHRVVPEFVQKYEMIREDF